MAEIEREERVSFDAIVKVSVCDICGEEKRAEHRQFGITTLSLGRESRDVMVGNSWRYPTHQVLSWRDSLVGDYALLGESKRPWELVLCPSCARELAIDVRAAVARLKNRIR